MHRHVPRVNTKNFLLDIEKVYFRDALYCDECGRRIGLKHRRIWLLCYRSYCIVLLSVLIMAGIRAITEIVTFDNYIFICFLMVSAGAAAFLLMRFPWIWILKNKLGYELWIQPPPPLWKRASRRIGEFTRTRIYRRRTRDEWLRLAGFAVLAVTIPAAVFIGIADARYIRAVGLYDRGEFYRAYTIFESLGSYRSSEAFKEDLTLCFGRAVDASEFDMTPAVGPWIMADILGMDAAKATCALHHVGQPYEIRYTEDPASVANAVVSVWPFPGTILSTDETVVLTVNDWTGNGEDGLFYLFDQQKTVSRGEWLYMAVENRIYRCRYDFSDVSLLYEGVDDIQKISVKSDIIYFTCRLDGSLYSLGTAGIGEVNKLVDTDENSTSFAVMGDSLYFTMDQNGTRGLYCLDLITNEYELFIPEPISGRLYYYDGDLYLYQFSEDQLTLYSVSGMRETAVLTKTGNMICDNRVLYVISQDKEKEEYSFYSLEHEEPELLYRQKEDIANVILGYYLTGGEIYIRTANWLPVGHKLHLIIYNTETGKCRTLALSENFDDAFRIGDYLLPRDPGQYGYNFYFNIVTEEVGYLPIEIFQSHEYTRTISND